MWHPISVQRLGLTFLKDTTMHRFTAGAIVLVLLPLTGCTDSPTELPKQLGTAETAHHEHKVASHSPRESPAAKPHKQHGHGHGNTGRNTSAADHPPGIAIGDVVPDFEVTINGASRKLTELQKDASLTEDGTLSFTFWCSFCHSCRDVEADLDKLATKYKGKVGIIALDASAGETMDAVTEFAKHKGLSLPIALNPDGAAADLFGVSTTTTTVVIDSKGVLRYRGRFQDHEHAYTDNAIVAVLAGSDVVVKETAHRG